MCTGDRELEPWTLCTSDQWPNHWTTQAIKQFPHAAILNLTFITRSTLSIFELEDDPPIESHGSLYVPREGRLLEGCSRGDKKNSVSEMHSKEIVYIRNTDGLFPADRRHA